MNQMFFIHIPKCGGTSYQSVLIKTYGDNVSLVYQKPEDFFTSVENRGGYAGLRFLSSHLDFEELKNIPARFKPFVILRNPVDRIKSSYQFLYQHPNGDPKELKLVGFEGFLLSEKWYNFTSNRMTRQLSGNRQLPVKDWMLPLALENLRKCSFSILEEPTKTRRVLWDDFEIQTPPILKKNVSKLQIGELTQKQKDLAMMSESYDMILYNEAKRMLGL